MRNECHYTDRARWRGDRKFFRPPLNSNLPPYPQRLDNRILCCFMLPCGALKLCFTLKSCFFSVLWGEYAFDTDIL